MTEPVSTISLMHSRDDNPDHAEGWGRVSWGVIFTGVAFALVMQLLLNLLSAGIGAAVIDPSVSTVVWFVVSGIIASFMGGYISRRLSGRPGRSTGALHCLTSCAVTTPRRDLSTDHVCPRAGWRRPFGTTRHRLQRRIDGCHAAATAAPATATTTSPMAGVEQQVRDAILAFIALAVGAIAASIGGAVGTAEVSRDDNVYVNL